MSTLPGRSRTVPRARAQLPWLVEQKSGQRGSSALPFELLVRGSCGPHNRLGKASTLGRRSCHTRPRNGPYPRFNDRIRWRWPARRRPGNGVTSRKPLRGCWRVRSAQGRPMGPRFVYVLRDRGTWRLTAPSHAHGGLSGRGSVASWQCQLVRTVLVRMAIIVGCRAYTVYIYCHPDVFVL